MSDRIRALREQRGWTQSDLASRAGVTRQLVGAVEADRHSPNVGAALALAQALGVSVEALFSPHQDVVTSVSGDQLPAGTPVITVRVGDSLVAIPIDHGVTRSELWAVADAVSGDESLRWLPGASPGAFVIAGCDPMLGLLSGLVERTGGHRVITVHASTASAIDALAEGRVHGVLVHAPVHGLPAPPVDVQRWHVARWQVGLASPGRATRPDIAELAHRRMRVVQRDAGASSQRAFERALHALGVDSAQPGPVGDGHLDVARRVAQGGGKAGVTMESAARAFGLGFTPLEEHAVELWLDVRWATMPVALALLDVLTSSSLAQRVALLGGYDLSDCAVRRAS
jgi:transcriptional regulator with XRE-family HTH domain